MPAPILTPAEQRFKQAADRTRKLFPEFTDAEVASYAALWLYARDMAHDVGGTAPVPYTPPKKDIFK